MWGVAACTVCEDVEVGVKELVCVGCLEDAVMFDDCVSVMQYIYGGVEV